MAITRARLSPVRPAQTDEAQERECKFMTEEEAKRISERTLHVQLPGPEEARRISTLYVELPTPSKGEELMFVAILARLHDAADRYWKKARRTNSSDDWETAMKTAAVTVDIHELGRKAHQWVVDVACYKTETAIKNPPQLVVQGDCGLVDEAIAAEDQGEKLKQQQKKAARERKQKSKAGKTRIAGEWSEGSFESRSLVVSLHH
ncbi:hypothetical protein PRZ48_008832 [Zasmidium cellare]|uniref:Uncharacterized protein n=1 Tax=Zasmidium cellare TaxID=395010 RepID=A0ABR0EHG5_ZASCE|nr:hypothetical protein PRZ48_008832 [Zasmidium cellare]